MRVKFEMRSQRKGVSVLVPIYVRMWEGKYFNQSVKTSIVVPPNYWDPKGETIKARCMCPPDVRTRVVEETADLKAFLLNAYAEDRIKESFETNGWLLRTVKKYNSLKSSGKLKPKGKNIKKESFDDLFNEFLESRELGLQRRKHYEVLRRILHRYVSYVKYSMGRQRYSFDVNKVDKEVLSHLYDYMQHEPGYIEQYPKILEDHPETRDIVERGENTMCGFFKQLRAFFNWCYKEGKVSAYAFDGFEMPKERYGSPIYLSLEDVNKIANADFSEKPDLERQRDIFVFHCNIGCRVGDLLRLTKNDVINGTIEYIPTKTIKDTAKTVVVPLNSVAQGIIDKYKDLPGDKLLPFISTQKYNDSIKEVFTLAGVDYLVTELDPVSRTEKKVPINEIASSHMARRTFIGNIYKLVKDPNLVSALTGHVEGSRAFNRYRTIDIDMKKDLVKMLEIQNK